MLKGFEVFVIADNEITSRSNCTINKLIIVIICCDKTPIKMIDYEMNIW